MRSQGCIKKKKKLFRGGIRRVGWEFEILKTLARKKQSGKKSKERMGENKAGERTSKRGQVKTIFKRITKK